MKEIMALFLKLGILGFGGPAAHVAMMEDEVVLRIANAFQSATEHHLQAPRVNAWGGGGERA